MSPSVLDVYVGSPFDIVLTHPRSTPSLRIFDCIAGSLEREALQAAVSHSRANNFSSSTWFLKDPGMPQSPRMTMALFYKSLLGS
jgi:hypothetical protein